MKTLILVLGVLVVATAAAVFTGVLPLALEYLIAALTAEVAVLTVALVWYAAETLKVSRRSLAFFLQPSVSVDCPEETTSGWTSEGGGGRPTTYYRDLELAVWNDSAMEIRIERKGTRLPEILSVDAEGYDLADVTMGDTPNGHIQVDGVRFWGWPATVRKSLRRRYRLAWKRIGQVPPKTLRVRLRYRVDYWYRGEQQPPAEREVDFVLHGPDNK